MLVKFNVLHVQPSTIQVWESWCHCSKTTAEEEMRVECKSELFFVNYLHKLFSLMKVKGFVNVTQMVPCNLIDA